MQIVDVLLALLFLSSAYIFVRAFSHTKALYSFLLLSSAALSTLFFERLFQGSDFSIRLIYPWILPLLFAVGPSYYLSNSKTIGSPSKALLHFIPALTIITLLLIHKIIYPEDFNKNLSTAVKGEFVNSSFFWIFTDDLLILLYPVHGGAYVYFSLMKFIENKSYSNFAITVNLLLTLFSFLEYLNVIFYDFSITGLSQHELRFISIIGAFGLVAYYLFYYKTIMSKKSIVNTSEATMPMPVDPVMEPVKPII